MASSEITIKIDPISIREIRKVVENLVTYSNRDKARIMGHPNPDLYDWAKRKTGNASP